MDDEPNTKVKSSSEVSVFSIQWVPETISNIVDQLYGDSFIYLLDLLRWHCCDADSLTLNNHYHCVLQIFHVNWYHCILLYIFHRTELVGKSWAHDVRSLQNEFQSSRINCKPWEDVRVHMYEFQGGDSFFLDVNEMVIIIDNDMFAFLFVTSFHFERHDFGLFIPKDRNLFIREFRLGQKRLSHVFGLRLADCLFMACLLRFFQHVFDAKSFLLKVYITW